MSEDTKKDKPKYAVPALENAFKIIRLLSRKRFRQSTLTEIANALSLSPTTCFRILRNLEDQAIVRYEKNKKRYTLGPYLVVLGERAKEHLDYISIVTPYLEQLTKETGLTSVLVSRVGEDKLTIIAKEEGDDYGVHVSIGRHFSITDGSYGLCFMAYLDQKTRNKYLKNSQGLKNIEMKDIAMLEEDFNQIRDRGYAVTYGEYINGICGVAAPIFSSEGKVELVIALFGLTAQSDIDSLHSKGILLKNAADKATEEIGGL